MKRGNLLRVGLVLALGFPLAAGAQQAAPPGQAEATQPVGMITSVLGKVRISRQGQSLPARAADLLMAGDRLTASPGAHADYLYCPELRAGRVPPAAEVAFEASGLRVIRGSVANEWKIPSCRLPSTSGLTEASRQHLGITRLRSFGAAARINPALKSKLLRQYELLLPDSELVLGSPANTNVATLRPNFRWSPVKGAKSYDFLLTDREERVLWKTRVFVPELRYPVAAYKLAWGQRYWWRVIANGATESTAEAASYFQVLPEAQARAVQSAATPLRTRLLQRPSDPAPQLALAFLYEENGMLDEAAMLYQRMTSPDWARTRFIELAQKLGWAVENPQ